MNTIGQIIIASAIGIGGIASFIYSFLHKSKDMFSDLKHCKVPDEWVSIRNISWDRASLILSQNGYTPKTKCKTITIEAGIKVNPKTGQWGRPMMMNGSEFWYAGLSGSTDIKIVATPEKKPYNRSQAILTHEAAESILTANGCTMTIDERNTYLWNLGL